MNSQNYLGSSLLIINLDVTYRREEDINFKIEKFKNAKTLPPESLRKYEKLVKKQSLQSKLSKVIEETYLPPIK